jgi:hypothetical protein
MRLNVFIVCVHALLPTTAWASGAWVTTQSRMENTHVSLGVTPTSFGVGFLRADGWGFEASGALREGVWTLHASHLKPLVERGLFSLAWQAGALGMTILRGTADVSVGLQTGLYAGLGGPSFDAFSGVSLASDVFFRDVGVRLRPRGVFGLRGNWGRFRYSAVLQVGQDFEAATFPTWRADALLTVGWALP